MRVVPCVCSYSGGAGDRGRDWGKTWSAASRALFRRCAAASWCIFTDCLRALQRASSMFRCATTASSFSRRICRSTATSSLRMCSSAFLLESSADARSLRACVSSCRCRCCSDDIHEPASARAAWLASLRRLRSQISFARLRVSEMRFAAFSSSIISRLMRFCSICRSCSARIRAFFARKAWLPSASVPAGTMLLLALAADVVGRCCSAACGSTRRPERGVRALPGLEALAGLDIGARQMSAAVCPVSGEQQKTVH